MTTRKETESETKTMWVYLSGVLFSLHLFYLGTSVQVTIKKKQNVVRKVMLTWMRGWRKVGGQINYNVII